MLPHLEGGGGILADVILGDKCKYKYVRKMKTEIQRSKIYNDKLKYMQNGKKSLYIRKRIMLIFYIWSSWSLHIKKAFKLLTLLAAIFHHYLKKLLTVHLSFIKYGKVCTCLFWKMSYQKLVMLSKDTHTTPPPFLLEDHWKHQQIPSTNGKKKFKSFEMKWN